MAHLQRNLNQSHLSSHQPTELSDLCRSRTCLAPFVLARPAVVGGAREAASLKETHLDLELTHTAEGAANRSALNSMVPFKHLICWLPESEVGLAILSFALRIRKRHPNQFWK